MVRERERTPSDQGIPPPINPPSAPRPRRNILRIEPNPPNNVIARPRRNLRDPFDNAVSPPPAPKTPSPSRSGGKANKTKKNKKKK
jgi:hypothetical protein